MSERAKKERKRVTAHIESMENAAGCYEPCSPAEMWLAAHVGRINARLERIEKALNLKPIGEDQ